MFPDARAPAPGTRADGEERAWLGRILTAVRARRGVDFRGYRAGTLLRRVRSRMIVAGVSSPDAYLERLWTEPGEADALIERFTIKVSRFFRVAACFEALQRALAERRAACRGALRLWSAGCGQGEEPYSLAMLLAELGPPPAAPDVLATDLDAAALARARLGIYEEAALAEVSPSLRARYLPAEPGRGGGAQHLYRVHPGVRERVAFRVHDLTGSARAPEGERFDLVCCRNVLIYLERPLRARVEALLAGSLLPGGLLCLGEAEWPASAVASRLDVVDRKARIFRLRAAGAGGGSNGCGAWI